MTLLLNHPVLAKLGESMQAEVFKVQAPDSERFWVLKKVKSRFCIKGMTDYVSQQIDQLRALQLPHTLIPEILGHDHGALVLKQDFIDARPLSQSLPWADTPAVDAVLRFAIELAERLETVHKAGHIHKSLKPSNILLRPDGAEFWLIDDVRILDINQVSHFIYDPGFRVETLPFLSPEQTGRIKHTVSYTTDLYSLGMVLYACLVGKPPFCFDDPVAIIHSHLAETPENLHARDARIPAKLAEIIARLLAKAPEKRYQTASGLAHDLRIVLRQWQRGRVIEDFPLQQKDFSHRITIPSVMVGRDHEKQALLNEFKKVCSGVFRAASISGFSGIGKTRLIQELQLPVVASHGYFTSGKFDQFQKHIPYSTLIQAFTGFIKTILSEDQARIDAWRQRIGERLGDHGQLMIDLVPELAWIIGPQPVVPDLPPVEARNRFNDTIGCFIAALADQEHPLTLFIDDLQWCDGATFDVLESLFDNALDYPWVFWVGAYRHNEVDASHRLTGLLERIRRGKQSLLEIRLNALGRAEVNLMTAYILNTYPMRTEALANIIFQTSTGNPLFVNESLRWLHRYRHLHLGDDGVWSWDDDQLRHTRLPETALDLFKDKIAKLKTPTQALLMIGACLGAHFPAEDLAQVADMNLAALYRALADAFAENILLCEKDQLYFFHDQVQAAVESCMDTAQKRAIHERIASAYIAALPDAAEPNAHGQLFAIVEHLHNGRPEQPDNARRQQEAVFNYHAGIAAMKALAMDNANFFFSQAKALYPEPSWTRDYDFLFPLYKYLARTEMALGNQPASEVILHTLVAQAKNDLDRVDCLYEQTTGLSSMGKFKEAIELGNRGLNYFGRAIPGDDDLALTRAAKILERIHRDHDDVWQRILDITPSGDRATRIETGIYSELIPDYYLAGMVPQLYLSAIQSTQNCLAGGVDETVIYGFSMVGLYLQRQDRYTLSFRYEDLGLALSERYPDTFGATKGINGILWTNMHNRRDSEHIIQQCQRNIHRGKNCGDLYNAGLSYGPYLWHLIHQGADFQHINEVAQQCRRFSRKFNLSLSLGLAESVLAGWCDAMCDKRAEFDDRKIQLKLAQWAQAEHVVLIGGFYTLKGLSGHFLGDYAQAATYLTQAEPYLRGLSDNILNRLWYVFRYVNGLRLHDTPDAKERETWAHCLERVTTWASLGPILRPYLTWMKLEQAAHEQDFSRARGLALDAIDQADAQHFVFLQGFVHERLGQLLSARQHPQAGFYFHQAQAAYQHCGAEVKALQLVQKHTVAMAEPYHRNDTSLNQLLDIDYLVQATRAITQQLDLKPLLGVIMKSVMARLGAKTGYLLIAEQQHLDVLAKAVKYDAVEVEIHDRHVLDTPLLSSAIVNYVYRTQALVVLRNAIEEGDFKTDDTVQRQQLKSVLCVPLQIQQQVLGVLYLENHLIKAVFSPEDIEMTRMLTAQAAIALQNTRLIESMKKSQQEVENLNKQLEERVSERTSALNRANEELEHFAYVVSHDLKAPLRAINQLSSWIAEDYSDAFDDEGREQMTLLQGRAKRMHEMIDGILQYSRVGRIKDPDETVDLNVLLQEIIRHIAPPEHITIQQTDRLPTVKGEKLRLFQVFQNLLDNAIKYNDKDQGLIEVSCCARDDFWECSIKDNGPGIAPGYQEKIFQLFQTLSPKDQSDSTGIGLSLIEKIVTHWGGEIRLESTPGEGCKFMFTLPKANAQ
ncbi:MAG: AAA family ATPase [Methylococcales bacterium]|nr:AAA family ATPase [Methylococcales bacterium]